MVDFTIYRPLKLSSEINPHYSVLMGMMVDFTICWPLKLSSVINRHYSILMGRMVDFTIFQPLKLSSEIHPPYSALMDRMIDLTIYQSLLLSSVFNPLYLVLMVSLHLSEYELFKNRSLSVCVEGWSYSFTEDVEGISKASPIVQAISLNGENA